MKVSVILVSYNTVETTKQALEFLFKSKGTFEIEVVIVDNASRDNSVAELRKHYPNIKLIENAVNVGFGRANNQALLYITGDYVLLLNTDAFVEDDTLQKTLDYMAQAPKCGILGVKLIGRDGVLQPSCRYFPTVLNTFLVASGLSRIFKNVRLVDDMDWDHASVRHCDWVPGCYYLIRKEVVDTVGLFDPLYFLYYEEVDHCLATKKAGWEVTYFPFTTVIHIGGESAKSIGDISSVGRQLQPLQIESEMLYYRKNNGLLGLFLSVTSNFLLDFIYILKGLLKLRGIKDFLSHVNHIKLVIKLLFKTGFARHATK